MQELILVVQDLTVKLGGKTILEQVGFSMEKGMCLAVIGHTGSGKTTLLKALKGTLFHAGLVQYQPEKPKVSIISRQHYFTNKSNLSSFYYQQRFNSFDADDAPTVEDELATIEPDREQVWQALEKVGLLHVQNARLIMLSNGEHKRLQIAKAILQQCEWLLMDAPFIGLDTDARMMLNTLLLELRQAGIHILITTGHSTLPDAITHTLVLENGRSGPVLPASQYPPHSSDKPQLDSEALKNLPGVYPEESFVFALKLVNVTIQYGESIILDNINWEVKKGECWNLRGHNGSGKSTLISLINGDNPQAFSQEIYLFDKRKGSGESIWDIKRKTGFVSPELHHYVETGSSVFDMVASGLFDTMGLFRKLSEAQQDIVNCWLKQLHLNSFAERMFHSMSDGEQRKVLLARALVKNPPLLLLDEPCQGLDETATREFTQLIDLICRDLGKTLIYVSHYDTEIPSCVTHRLTLERGIIKKS